MVNLEIKHRCEVIPIEEVAFEDATQTCKKILTTVNKTFVAGGTRSYMPLAANVKYKETYNTTTSPVAFSHSTIFNSSTIASLVFVKINRALSTGTPTIIITLGAETTGGLVMQGVGEGFVMPIFASMGQIFISSPSSTTLAEVEILTGHSLISEADAIE